MNPRLPILAVLGLLNVSLPAADNISTDTAAQATQRLFTATGIPADDRFFPIAVWLQSPANASRVKTAGINLYVGLWDGPTKAQLVQLQKAGMHVICDQNKIALENKDDPIIAGWMHGDEPDNAQSLGEGKGYGPPVPPANIIREYQQFRTADPTRPVMLNLGQGVAWDDYIGRGVRRNHPEDYAGYTKGCDIASFDIYPVVHESPQIAGKLEFVAGGVERLVKWTSPAKPVWNCVECTHIENPSARATPQQVRSEVWMGLISGSRGIIYFVHQFKPVFREAALLDDPEMLQAVAAINRQITDLAPVLNIPTLDGQPTVQASGPDAKIASMAKHYDHTLYLFTVNLRNQSSRATLAIRNKAAAENAEVLGESRSLSVQAGNFTDDFAPYAVHLYRIPDK